VRVASSTTWNGGGERSEGLDSGADLLVLEKRPAAGTADFAVG
jgi:hypothetical protein